MLHVFNCFYGTLKYTSRDSVVTVYMVQKWFLLII